MEGTRTQRSQTLAVLQEFAGGRLERHVWSRAYELAAPVARVVVAAKIRIPNSAEPCCQAELIPQTISKGA